MAIDIARREFILAFGGAAVAWPIAAGAQQSRRMRRMGLLVGYAENDSEAQAHIAALRETLQKLGWTANHDIQINERWASGDVDKMHRYAAELVRLNPDVIVGVSVSVVVALRNETRSIPIVFTRVSDPIGSGLDDESIAAASARVCGPSCHADDFRRVAKRAGEVDQRPPRGT